jgi:DNA-directed RNA polymerase subunit RPC12/RpoP
MGCKNNYTSFREKYDNDFLNKYWDYKNNKINPKNIGIGSRKLIWIKCQEHDYHGSYEIMAYAFNQGNRCPYCSGKKVHRLDSLGYRYPISQDLWSDKNNLSPFEISCGSGKDIWLKCPDGLHNDYKTKPYRAKEHYFKCPKCSSEQNVSSLQKKVEDIIKDEFGFDMLKEYECTILPKNPKHSGGNDCMPFDIEIPYIQLIIEVQGEQHDNITGWTRRKAKRNMTTPKYELKMQQLRDRYKKYIAWKNGYEYLAIPYWFEWKDNYKDLVRNKIYKILLSK